MRTLPSTIVFATYFGPLPDYLPLWLHSCGTNPRISWLLVTDQDVSRHSFPGNVRVLNLGLADLEFLIRQNTGHAPKGLTPYKLCDFRCAFGQIFHEQASGFDYWGHCDFDVLFGRLEDFLLANDLGRYDRFLTCGHLSLYRNDSEINSLYKKKHPDPFINWEDIFQSEINIGFDEHNGINRIMKEHGCHIFDNEMAVADLHPSYRELLLVHGRNYRHQAFVWADGRVQQCFANKTGMGYREFPYIHFQKRTCFAAASNPARLITAGTLLTRDGFVPFSVSSLLDEVAKSGLLFPNFRLILLKARLRKMLAS